MKSTGYISDPITHKRAKYRASREGIAALPKSASLLPFAVVVLDQNQTGSCTGGSTAAALATALSAKGTPLPWIPSPKGIYTLGRAVDRVPDSHGVLPPLSDNGAQPNQVMRGITEWGIRPMGPLVQGCYYDCDPSDVNEEPTLGELEDDAKNLILGEHAITTTGVQRITDICTAIASRKPVTVAIAGGSDAFQEYTGGILPALHAPLDHYVWILGYETDAHGQCIITVRNQWGPSWGESGNVRLSEAAVQELGDLVVLDVHLKGAA